jgi:hypothetical protein
MGSHKQHYELWKETPYLHILIIIFQYANVEFSLEKYSVGRTCMERTSNFRGCSSAEIHKCENR